MNDKFLKILKIRGSCIVIILIGEGRFFFGIWEIVRKYSICVVVYNYVFVGLYYFLVLEILGWDLV